MSTFEKMTGLASKVFTKADSSTHLIKIKEEVDEALESYEIEEFADILLALYAAVGKAGYSENQLKSAAEKKLKTLKKRKWDFQNGQYHHKK